MDWKKTASLVESILHTITTEHEHYRALAASRNESIGHLASMAICGMIAEQMDADPLLSAAPDLLAALTELLAECEGYRYLNYNAGLLVAARKAIAKAKGETS